jgi:hypothetical protein
LTSPGAPTEEAWTFGFRLQATSNKQQATSNKQQATSNKQQAATFCRRTKWIIDLSVKHQAACVKVYSLKKI